MACSLTAAQHRAPRWRPGGFLSPRCKQAVPTYREPYGRRRRDRRRRQALRRLRADQQAEGPAVAVDERPVVDQHGARRRERLVRPHRGGLAGGRAPRGAAFRARPRSAQRARCTARASADNFSTVSELTCQPPRLRSRPCAQLAPGRGATSAAAATSTRSPPALRERPRLALAALGVEISTSNSSHVNC
jgi:hypothetical protein